MTSYDLPSPGPPSTERTPMNPGRADLGYRYLTLPMVVDPTCHPRRLPVSTLTSSQNAERDVIGFEPSGLVSELVSDHVTSSYYRRPKCACALDAAASVSGFVTLSRRVVGRRSPDRCRCQFDSGGRRTRDDNGHVAGNMAAARGSMVQCRPHGVASRGGIVMTTNPDIVPEEIAASCHDRNAA
jgi:hypothetical protein